MSGRGNKGGKGRPDAATLAAQLRANLLRRKQQQRHRQQGDDAQGGDALGSEQQDEPRA